MLGRLDRQLAGAGKTDLEDPSRMADPRAEPR